MKSVLLILLVLSQFLKLQAQSSITIPELVGEWRSSSGATFHIRQTDEGFKISPDLNSFALFKKIGSNTYSCYDVKKGLAGGLYTPQFIGSIIEVKASNHVVIVAQPKGEKNAWRKMAGAHMDVEDGFYVDGVRLGKIVKTFNGSMLSGAMPEFTIYDVKGVARFLFERWEGKIIFLDDNKSYLPRIVDANVNSILALFAYDSILTSEGYNLSYRARFIKKYRGTDLSPTMVQNLPVNTQQKTVIAEVKNKEVAAPRMSSKKLDDLRAAANQNDLNAQAQLATILIKSPNPQDHLEGGAWLKKAAENGHVESQNELADCYKWSEPGSSRAYVKFVQQNHAEALKWYRKAAEQGLDEAQWEVGIYYEVGYKVVEQDRDECLVWKLKAAKQGGIYFQYKLAQEYETGYDCAKKNRKEAIYWYTQVINNKNPGLNTDYVDYAKKKLKKWRVKL